MYIRETLVKLIILLISLIDAKETGPEKLIDSRILHGVEILSDKGWSKASYIHITKKFKVYKVLLENGMSLYCADEHLIYLPDGRTVWTSDLRPGMLVQTIDSPVRVKSISISNRKVSMCDITVLNDKESYYTNGILSHNTTTSAIYLLHYILFNIDKNSLVLGNKRRTAVEILDKVKSIFYEIPYFLKPGVYKWNESEIVLDNGCRCLAEATTINSGISFTFHCILADEFAHIQPNILEKFYNNLFPTIVAGKAKFIISSTQNGFNLFQRLYVAAENGENDYAPFRVDWWQVPEWNPDTHQWDKRDEAWHRRQAANLGGEEAFQAQFGTKFMMIANSLVDSRYITERLTSEDTHNFEPKYLPGVSYSEYYYWRKDFEPAENLNKFKIVVTIDIAEGIGQDHTVFMFNRIIDMDRVDCLGFFDCNTANPKKAAQSLCECINNFCDHDYTLLSVEFNTYGELFVRYIMDSIERQEVRFDESIILKYQIKDSKNFRNGIKMTPSNKPVYCTVFKQKFESGNIDIPSRQFLRQLENFADVKGNGSYQALVGHDDLVMAAIQIAAAQETMRYRYLAEEADPTIGGKNLNYFDFGMSPMYSSEAPSNPWLEESYRNAEMAQGLSDFYSGRLH